MLKKIIIAENSLEPETWLEFESENVLDFLIEYFKIWPENARIYNGNVSTLTDVTPSSIKEIEEISKMSGPFYVVVYPQWTYVPYIIALLVLAVTLLNQPKIPFGAVRNSDDKSANNSLSDRSNKARVNGRIADIFGQVRSVPDLIAANYKFFDNNVEYEHSYMCIGKGSYLVEDVKEDTTLISEVDASSVEIYGPFTSPNSGVPELTIGPVINKAIKTFIKYESVNGQILGPDSTYSVKAVVASFLATGRISVSPSTGIDFRAFFNAGGTVKVANAIYRTFDPVDHSYTEVYNFDGIYTITSVSQHYLVIANPTSNADWTVLIGLGLNFNFSNVLLFSNEAAWAGPFTCDRVDMEEIWCNFVSMNGIYVDDGTSKKPLPVDISLRLTPVNSSGSPIGAPEVFTTTLLWDSTFNMALGNTLKAVPTFTGRCIVEAKRMTGAYILTGQVQDEVKWRDFYAVCPMDKTDFGNVTTVQSLTRATEGALSVSNRKLNMLATRKVPTRISGSTFSTVLYPTKRVDDIISFICLDPKIGNRQLSEMDFDNIYSTVAEIISYFGTDKAAEFCYTFDSVNLSFEEILTTIANSIFSLAYRRGNKIRLSFEKETEQTTILFNHRNKVPGTESRNISFGNVNDNDGIEYQYVDPVDDAIVSIYVPEDRSAVNPKSFESIGVRNSLQAHFNAKRLYNKMKYQNLNVEFEALQEANICVINDRILVSDGTQLGSLEGEIVSQNGLELVLSQNVDLQSELEYTIFLQYSDGTVDNIPIVKTAFSNKVLLLRTPSMPLALDFDLYAKTTFIISPNNDTRKTAFILTEKSPKGVMTSELKAINYESRYYQNDKDFINNIIS